MDWTPSRVALAAITACVVVGGVGAGILLQPANDRHPPEAHGRNVSIAVVAPREPVPDPGGVMDVGDLIDDYTHRDHAPPAYAQGPADDFVDAYPPTPEPAAPERVERPREMAADVSPPPVPEARRERTSRWPFGFDPYRRDPAAERRARMVRREEQARFEERRAVRRFDRYDDYPDPPYDRGREAPLDREPRDRERQWYTSDGRPVPAPYESD